MRAPGPLQAMALIFCLAWGVAFGCHYLDSQHRICRFVDAELSRLYSVFSAENWPDL